MKMVKTLLAGVAAAMLVAAPVLAQTPSAGGAAGKTATYASMPIGSYVMIGGFIFVVTASGLVLLDDEDNPVVTTPPTTTTTTATTTTGP